MAVGQLQIFSLTHRHREQAPSHILISMYQIGISLLLLCF